MKPTERERLKIRIEHWIEHNAGHAEEFKELSDAVKKDENSDVSDDLLKAAGELQEANKWLNEALKKIGRK
jgi:hypothetical protein